MLFVCLKNAPLTSFCVMGSGASLEITSVMTTMIAKTKQMKKTVVCTKTLSILQDLPLCLLLK